jgi:tetratricopeptide (TPR) repeat protein
MEAPFRTGVLIVCLGLLAAPRLPAAAPGSMSPSVDTEQKPAKEEEAVPERKHPSFFHRPAKATPAAQLAYAQQLEAAGELRKAGKQYLALVHQWHQSPEAVKAQHAYADVLERRQRYVPAFDEYQYLIDNFTGRFDYNEVLDHQYRIAHVVATARHGAMFGFHGFESSAQAIPLYEKLVANAPNWDKAPEMQFYLAWLYEEDHQFEMAAKTYEAVQLTWPEGEYAPGAVMGRARSLYLLANSTPRDESACRQALAALATYLRDYAGSPQAAEAQKYLDELKTRLSETYYERAVFYDRIAKKPQAALIAYSDFIRQFPLSKQAAQVSERMEVLKVKVAAQAQKAPKK